MKFLLAPPRHLVLSVLAAAAASCATLDEIAGGLSANGGLTTQEIAAGLKEALTVGATQAVDSLGSKGGYGADSLLRIQFPKEAEAVESALKNLGLGSFVTAFENRLNEGAEAGARRALPIFKQAIQNMTIADAKAILTGSDHAATDYFKANTYSALELEFQPEMQSALGQTGAITAWKEITTQYNKIPFTSFKLDTDIVHYATQRALDGLFTKVEEEEAAIRADPVARTTALLKRVFGSTAP